MSESHRSYSQILRATSIIGSASVAKVVIGMARMKVLALLLGPAGVGLAGIYTNIMNTAGTFVGCGLGSSGVRQIAASSGDLQTLSAVRKTLWYANITLGMAGMAAVWFLRHMLSQWVFGDADHSAEIGWLGLGVLFTLILGSQTALLQGMRLLGDQARVSVIGTFLSSVVAVIIVYLLGYRGIVPFVLAVPLVSAMVAFMYTSRIPRPLHIDEGRTMRQQLLLMLRLGFVFMATALMQNLVQLFIRSLVARDLGLEATGHFQAAWIISMTYIGFVLGAMSADYYPKLTAVIGDRDVANRLVNQQTHVALLLAGPAILGMLTFSPWIIHLLYAPAFHPAGEILRWQVMGDLIKIFSWPMGFILLARGDGGVFLVAEAVWSLSYVMIVWLLLPQHGLIIAGVSYLIAYALNFIAIFAIAHSKQAFTYRSSNVKLLFGFGAAAVAIALASFLIPTMAVYVGSVVVAGSAMFSIRQLKVITKNRSAV